jgi:hypothetical protein
MAACYAPDARFSDPAFPDLRGDEIGDMWRMLCEAAPELTVEHSEVTADDARGRARWDARYPFGPGKRAVHNVITAEFEFADGRIVRHTDTFDFWRWSRMALGPIGLLLGWTPILRGRVQATVAKQLARWRQKRRA